MIPLDPELKPEGSRKVAASRILSRALSAAGRVKFPGRNRLLAYAAHVAPPLWSWPVEIAPGTSLHVDMRDYGAAALLFSRELEHERGLKRILSDLLSPGDCFWDVGANLGYYSALFSDPSRRIKVHAFEPNRAVAKLIERSVRGRDVVTHSIGLGAANENLTLRVPNQGLLRGAAVASFRAGMGGQPEMVRVMTADEVINHGAPRPDVMKIDVEGWEYHVLRGYGRVQEDRPALVIEWIEEMATQGGWAMNDVRQLLGPGWRYYRVRNDGRLVDFHNPTDTNDLVVVHDLSAKLATIEGLRAR